MQQGKSNEDDSFLGRLLESSLRGWIKNGYIPVEDKQLEEAVNHARESGLAGLIFYLVLGLVLNFSYAVAAMALFLSKDTSTYIVFASFNFIIYSALLAYVSHKSKQVLSYPVEVDSEIRLMLNLTTNLIHMAVGISFGTCVVLASLIPYLLTGALVYTAFIVLVAFAMLFFFSYRFDSHNRCD